MIVTLRAVAKAAGVHPSTASRALSARTRHLVNAEVAARVIETAEAMGYRPDQAASALRSGRSRLIGALVPAIANPVFAPILAGAAAALGEAGMALLVTDPGHNPERAHDMVAELAARRVDGLLIATAICQPDPATELARARGIPFVMIMRAGPGDAAVLTDNVQSIELALTHLRALGHTRIGYLGGVVAQTRSDRRDGFQKVMARHGLPAGDVEMTQGYDRAGGRRGAMALLERAQGLTALICGNDLLALGAIDAARAMGLRLPEQLSIVGHNDLPHMDLVYPPLTTMRLDYETMGRRAAGALLSLLDNGAPAVERMTWELVVRGSTAPPPPD
jgi:LacI family transcriptional regulator